MDARTLSALRGSIAKWEAIVAGTGVDRGAFNCPLCQEFYNYAGEGDCAGCPVAARTGQGGCGGSPYEAWHEATRVQGSPTETHGIPELIALAQAELDFLRSLLPEGERA